MTVLNMMHKYMLIQLLYTGNVFISYGIFRVLNHQYTLGLHNVMFVPGIERLAPEQQKAKWLPLAKKYQIIGTYAQTELGHGK